ncbi:TRAP transporter permease [Allorhizobium pseudoryzae]|uniref:TRAP transporter permease n=1 Tax=Allorhizobium pseudoryzae TaxID=379684 RepID=UPI003CFF2645
MMETTAVKDETVNVRLDEMGLVSRFLSLLVPVLALVWVVALPQRLGLLIYPEQIVALMFGASLAVVYLRRKAGDALVLRIANWGAGCLSIALGIYVSWRFPVLSEATHRYPTEALLLGILVTALSMEALRRVVGWTLIIIFALLFAYAVFGDWVPGSLQGRPMAAADVLRFLGTDSSAVWGQTLQIAAFVVVVFVLFGGLLIACGGGDFFTQLAMRVAGRGPGNSAKVAVTASALFGTVSGSAVSNVMSTGIMTIPLMKRAGFTPAQAGGIEAVASTGGQLMPPVMGAAAFLMAELLMVPYKAVALAAMLPAILYYLSVYVQIDFIARRDNIPSLSGLDRRGIVSVVRDGWLAVLGFAVLLFCIFHWNMRAEVAAVWAFGALAVTGLAAGFARSSKQGMNWRQMLNVVIDTGRTTCDVLLITAVSGMIIGLLSTTGLGFALSMYLLEFGGTSLFGLLLVTALIGIVLGLGLPTTGVYLLMAALAAPTLVQLGVEPMAAHMFVLYYGILSMITPPIALASFAASSLAGASKGQTEIEAFRFGWIAYFLPFLFIYKPWLLLIGSWAHIGYVFASSVLALVLVTGGLVGHSLKPLGPALRCAWLSIGLLVIAPLAEIGGDWLEYGISLIGLVLLVSSLVPTRRETSVRT